MELKQLRRHNDRTLILLWQDGHEGPVTLDRLRDACPCAGCKGETVLLRRFDAPEADKSTPGRYTLVGATPVGNYALQFTWGDGHAEGIYTLEQLRALCSCARCVPPASP